MLIVKVLTLLYSPPHTTSHCHCSSVMEPSNEGSDSDSGSETEAVPQKQVAKSSAQFLAFNHYLECSICYELKPMVNLPCGDMICEECYVLTRQSQRETAPQRSIKRFQCTVCQVTVDVSARKVPPINRQVSNFTELLDSIENRCDVLLHYLPRTIYCKTCQESICLQCYEERHVGHDMMLGTERQPCLAESDQRSSEECMNSSVIELKESVETNDIGVGTEEDIEPFHTSVEVQASVVTRDAEVQTDKSPECILIEEVNSESSENANYEESADLELKTADVGKNGEGSHEEQTTVDSDDEMIWNDYFEQLCRTINYVEANNSGDISFSKFEREYKSFFYLFNGRRVNLTSWVAEQRKLYREQMLPVKRLYKLLALSDKGTWKWESRTRRRDNNVPKRDGNRGPESVILFRKMNDMVRMRRKRLRVSEEKRNDSEESSDSESDFEWLGEKGISKQKNNDYFVLSSDDEDNSSVSEGDIPRGYCGNKRWRIGTNLLEGDECVPSSSQSLVAETNDNEVTNDSIPTPTALEEKYFVYNSDDWNMMWFQFEMYGRYHNNCHDVPVEHDNTNGVESSKSATGHVKPMSIGHWVACLKEKFLKQELCPEAAAKVAAKVRAGHLTLSKVTEKVSKNERVSNSDGRAAPQASGDKRNGRMDSAIISEVAPAPPFADRNRVVSTVNKVDMGRTPDSLKPITKAITTDQPHTSDTVDNRLIASEPSYKETLQESNSNVMKPQLCRGHGVLFRYKSRVDSRHYVGIGVVDAVFLPRSVVRILPFIFFSEKEDMYKRRHQWGHSSYRESHALSCLHKKWRLKSRSISEVSTSEILCNKIEFSPKGNTNHHAIGICNF